MMLLIVLPRKKSRAKKANCRQILEKRGQELSRWEMRKIGSEIIESSRMADRDLSSGPLAEGMDCLATLLSTFPSQVS